MTEIDIEGVIGWDVLAGDIREKLQGTDDDVTLRINSPGGDVPDGVAIHNAIRAHRRAGHAVTAQVTGLAASMATYIAMAAERIEVEDNATWMVHNPVMFAGGDYRELQRAGRVLDSLAAMLARAYTERTGVDVAAMRAAMDDEIWLFGDEIVGAGWADALVPAGDGAEGRDEALALAQAQFAAMRTKLADEDSPQQLEQIAALLPTHTPAAEAASPTMEAAMADTDPAAAPEAANPKTDADPAPEREADAGAEAAAAVTAERTRVAAILALCERVRMPRLAQALISEGASLDQARARVIDAWADAGAADIAPAAGHAMPPPAASWANVITDLNKHRG